MKSKLKQRDAVKKILEKISCKREGSRSDNGRVETRREHNPERERRLKVCVCVKERDSVCV